MSGDGKNQDVWMTPAQFLVNEGYIIEGVEKEKLIVLLKELVARYKDTISSYIKLPEEDRKNFEKQHKEAQQKIEAINDVLHRAGITT